MMYSPPTAAPGARPGLARAAEAVATLALFLWIGGLVSLGAFAAPEVFGQLGREPAGQLMGAIFRRFDALVLACVAIFGAAELARNAAGDWRRRFGRARAATAVIIASGGLVASAWLSPVINGMFERGVRRGVGVEGARMELIHQRAETAGKVAALSAVAWLFLGAVPARRAQTEGSEAS